MRKGTVVYIAIIMAVLIGIALIDAGTKRPVNWSKTYSLHDKIPFGLHILRHEINPILGNDRQVTPFGGSFYEQIDLLDSIKNYDNALLEISDYSWIYEADAKQVLDYVEKGGEMFISSYAYSEELLDTFGIEVEILNYAEFYPTDENTTYSLVGTSIFTKFEKNEEFPFFSKLNKNCEIHGHVHVKKKSLPNFISVKHGKGKIHLHLLPMAFTNYHLLNEESYNYASTALSVIKSKDIQVFDQYFYRGESRTPLRVVISTPGFSQAWYLLLIGLVLLLIFKGRREQRAVEVYTPEPNLSKEFAKTIGALYYESGQPGNIINKKIDYFLYDIRTVFQVDTLDLTNKKMIRHISLRSGIDEPSVAKLMQQLNKYAQRKDYTIDDVRTVNNVIEEFKRKANMI